MVAWDTSTHESRKARTSLFSPKPLQQESREPPSVYCGKEHIGTKTCPERRDKFSGSRERELIGSGKRERARERQRERERQGDSERRGTGVCARTKPISSQAFRGFVLRPFLPSWRAREREREIERVCVCVGLSLYACLEHIACFCSVLATFCTESTKFCYLWAKSCCSSFGDDGFLLGIFRVYANKRFSNKPYISLCTPRTATRATSSRRFRISPRPVPSSIPD